MSPNSLTKHTLTSKQWTFHWAWLKVTEPNESHLNLTQQLWGQSDQWGVEKCMVTASLIRSQKTAEIQQAKRNPGDSRDEFTQNWSAGRYAVCVQIRRNSSCQNPGHGGNSAKRNKKPCVINHVWCQYPEWFVQLFAKNFERVTNGQTKDDWTAERTDGYGHSYAPSPVRAITKSSSTFSATNISSNIVWLLLLHGTIQMKSNYT